MKRNGFTLIEIIIVVVIIATLAALSMPAIVQAIMRIEKEASVESAALSLRQFYIDARSKSLMNDTVYQLEIADDDTHMTFTPLSTNNELDTVYLSIPSGIRSLVTLEQKPLDDATYNYILGMFTITSTTTGNYVPIEEYSVKIIINEETHATVTLTNGYPKLEKRGDES